MAITTETEEGGDKKIITIDSLFFLCKHVSQKPGLAVTGPQ